MSQTPSQTQTPESFLHVYTREELENRLRELNEKVRRVYELWSEALRLLNKVVREIRGEVCWTITEKLYRAVNEIRDAVKDAIEDMAFHKIVFEDIEKFDINPYDFLEFYEKPLGVVLLKENESAKPIVIYTDYSRVWYTEGERYE